jgi:hypothetical protein
MILRVSATYFSVAVALPDSEPPGMCVYTNYDSMPEETSNDVGVSNTLLDDRCVDSLVEVPRRSLNCYCHDRLSMIWKARVHVCYKVYEGMYELELNCVIKRILFNQGSTLHILSMAVISGYDRL